MPKRSWTIRIDTDVYDCLKKMAAGFDTPNDVLRRMLNLPALGRWDQANGPKGGFQSGKNPAKIDAALPGTVEELVKKTGLDKNDVRIHCNFWRRKGYYTKNGAGRFRRTK